MEFNKTEAIAALRLIFQPGDVFEIRVLDAQTTAYSRPHTVSGYFDYDNIETAAELIEKTIRFARGIYYTPNPVHPALLARAANRLRDMGQRDPSTSDKDIPRRRWLLIDCDAIRPSGISSTDEEHQAALDKAQEIKTGLESIGFTSPVEIDSGNGAQLMYRVDLPGGIEDGICKKVLQRLQACNSPAVEVDETVFNSARIWRLPGSVNAKGDPIPDRPHRVATIIRRPETLELVPQESLFKAAGIEETKPFDPADYPKNPGANLSAILGGVNLAQLDTSPDYEQFDLETWVAKYCPEANGPQAWQDGKKWVFPVCPFNPDHTDKSAVITQQRSGAVGFMCHHDGCKGKDLRALRELREPGFIEREAERERRTAEKARGEVVPAAAQPVPKSPEPAPEAEIIEPEPEMPAPWRDVTNAQIVSAIEKTILGRMTATYASVTNPPLPLEAALLKAIVTAGCALSGPGTPDMAQHGFLPPVGVDRARLRINTAGGQVCNVYAMLSANSASGKDIGNLLDSVTTARGWNMGTSGSAEGIAEALKNQPNGLLSISELENWLDERHWQHKATSFLTEAFNKGFFRHNFSSRSGKGGLSECDYCFPNISANIQPEVFDAVVRRQDVASGFLARFIYAQMPEFFGEPSRIDRPKVMQLFNGNRDQPGFVDLFLNKHGVVDVPEGYGTGLSNMFKKYSPDKLHPVWRRLVNEYLPRFAVMLSITLDKRTQGERVIIEDAQWHDAELLVQWFFKHAENMLSGVEDISPAAKIQDKLMKRFARTIAKLDRGDGVSTALISRYANHTGTDAMSRQRLLAEMVEQGWLSSTEPACRRGAKFKIATPPPGVL
ncbi:MAG: hypothetical protein VB042_02910 [Victivallaceae bacterium]|nr:hypothetical protein [Victivallaceae bacterium]